MNDETNEAIVKLLEMVAQAGSQQSVASHLGISAAYLSDILKGKRGVSKQVAKKLGLIWTLIPLDENEKN
jgi:plasmid maintenance system antidote protein VapI